MASCVFVCAVIVDTHNFCCGFNFPTPCGRGYIIIISCADFMRTRTRARLLHYTNEPTNEVATIASICCSDRCSLQWYIPLL